MNDRRCQRQECDMVPTTKRVLSCVVAMSMIGGTACASRSERVATLADAAAAYAQLAAAEEAVASLLTLVGAEEASEEAAESAAEYALQSAAAATEAEEVAADRGGGFGWLGGWASLAA